MEITLGWRRYCDVFLLSARGLWSLYLPMGCNLALVYLDHIPSFIGSEGFKVLEVVYKLAISHRFCL